MSDKKKTKITSDLRFWKYFVDRIYSVLDIETALSVKDIEKKLLKLEPRSRPNANLINKALNEVLMEKVKKVGKKYLKVSGD